MTAQARRSSSQVRARNGSLPCTELLFQVMGRTGTAQTSMPMMITTKPVAGAQTTGVVTQRQQPPNSQWCGRQSVRDRRRPLPQNRQLRKPQHVPGRPYHEQAPNTPLHRPDALQRLNALQNRSKTAMIPLAMGAKPTAAQSRLSAMATAAKPTAAQSRLSAMDTAAKPTAARSRLSAMATAAKPTAAQSRLSAMATAAKPKAVLSRPSTMVTALTVTMVMMETLAALQK